MRMERLTRAWGIVTLLMLQLLVSGCDEVSVPEGLRAPKLPSVSAEADGETVVLSARFASQDDMAAVVEFGFYFGEDKTSLERLPVTKSAGLTYSLIEEELSYSQTYYYSAWISNGKNEKVTEVKEVVTGKMPVGPNPPQPIEQGILFADPEVKSICLENWDLDGDGELSEAEAAGVTDLGMVFRRNDRITSFNELEYFSGLKEIADSAFAGCVNLQDIKLPESVTVIGQRAFLDCANLLLSSLPPRLVSIKNHAFAGCAKMPLNSLPETITEIEFWAFARCGSITLTSLPPDLTIIDGGSFSDCPGVTPSKLPEKITYIGDWAFYNDKYFNPESIPSGVKEIGKYAFQGCESLSWTSLPSGLLEIGEYAFWFCYKLKLSELPPKIFTVREGTFENCYSLEDITLPHNLERIGPRAFANCRFAEITIPEYVRFIGSQAFSGCSHLRQVTALPVNPPKMEDMFIGENANAIYVPKASLEKYKAADNWSRWNDKYKAIDGTADPDPQPDPEPDPDPQPDPGPDVISYIDDGVDYGGGVKISGTVWAPVNCGYRSDTYPFGRLYQWGRRFGFGYSDSNYRDASTPILRQGPVDYTEGNLERNSNVFFTASAGFWATSRVPTLWNKGTESAPVKTENDPCPSGWRVPTLREIDALGSNYSELVTYKGVRGRWFSGNTVYGSGVPAIFLPVAGYISNQGVAKHRQAGNSYDAPEGLYWSSTPFSYGSYYSAKGLRLTPSYVDIVYGQADAYTIRCVAE